MNLLRKVARVKDPRSRVLDSGIVLFTQLLAKRLLFNMHSRNGQLLIVLAKKLPRFESTLK
jgi:hypothetical protein